MLITKFKLLISMCIYFACMPSVVDAETYYPGAGGRMGIIDYYTDEEPKSEPVPAAYGDVFEPIKSVCSCSEKALPAIEQDLLKKMKEINNNEPITGSFGMYMNTDSIQFQKEYAKIADTNKLVSDEVFSFVNKKLGNNIELVSLKSSWVTFNTEPAYMLVALDVEYDDHSWNSTIKQGTIICFCEGLSGDDINARKSVPDYPLHIMKIVSKDILGNKYLLCSGENGQYSLMNSK